MRRAILLTLTVVMCASMLTGCTRPLRERIVMLEDENQALGKQLTDRNRDLEECEDARLEMQGRLVALQTETDQLRQQLANMPEPEPVMVEAEGWTPVSGGSMIALSSEILFRSGSQELKSEAKRELDRIVSDIRGTYSDRDVLVLGHTDSQPIKKSGFDDNYQLSTERALSVVRYLKSKGVSAEQLVAGGCGEHRPRASNSTPKSMARNRRVEIYAITLQ